MKKWQVLQIKSPGESPAPYAIQAITFWDSVEQFEKAVKEDGTDIVADIKNFSSEMPTRLVGDVITKGMIEIEE